MACTVERPSTAPGTASITRQGPGLVARWEIALAVFAWSPPQEPAPEPAHIARFTLSPRRVGQRLALTVALLALVSLAEQYVIHILGRADLEEFLIAVDVDAEANIPTWFSSVQLLACAALLGVIAARVRRDGGRYAGHWGWLSALFIALSIDELAQLHEHLGRLQSVWHTHGLFYFAWVIPAGVFVAALSVVYLRFLAHLPALTRRRFVIAGIVFVTGALVVEALGGWRAETMGMNNMTHSCIATVEEVMEMSGVTMFLVALMRHLAGEGADLTLEFRDTGRHAT